MNRNYICDDATEATQILLASILADGQIVPSRAGETREFTHVGITLQQPLNRELLCEGRKANVAAQVAETMWILTGRDDINWLSNYLPRVFDFSDDGETWRAGYGARLRRWWVNNDHSAYIDQVDYVVELLKKDPGSRQAVMSIWDPQTDTAPGKDIPCNDWLHFLQRDGFLDLHVAIRSNDAIWGWSGINQFEWSALQEVVAALCGFQVGNLHFSVTSWHLYEHHFEKAHKIAYSPRVVNKVASSPRFAPPKLSLGYFTEVLCWKWFEIETQIRSGNMSAEEVDSFPEPMLKSWLRVLQWWWSGNEAWLFPLVGTRLYQACQVGLQPKPLAGTRLERACAVGLQPKMKPIREQDGLPVRESHSTPEGRKFTAYVTELHNEKHKAYGDSWKRRGEMLGIMANIARKIDRLGGGETADETSADTAIDLLVYLAKYRAWLTRDGITDDYPDNANRIIRDLERRDHGGFAGLRTEAWLTEAFEQLEEYVTKQPQERLNQVDRMLPVAYRLAFQRWSGTQDEVDLGFVGGDYDLP